MKHLNTYHGGLSELSGTITILLPFRFVSESRQIGFMTMTAHTRCRRLLLGCVTPLLACSASVSLPSMLSAQSVQPLFELFATYGRPALAPSVADAYARAGGVSAGGGVGAAVGAMIGRFEVAGFYELGTASVVRRANADRPADFTRSAAGLRMELPLPELGRQFRGLLSASLFVQQLDSVSVPGVSATAPIQGVAQRMAPGGRVEVGVEHRGFIGTTWFATGGLAMAGAGSGRWQAATDRRGGIGVAPIITLGLRTRQW